jgi:hypothetical protein
MQLNRTFTVSRSILASSYSCLGVVGVALSLSLLIAGIQGQAATSLEIGAHVVNRTHKGDRLPLVPTVHLDDAKPSQETVEPLAPPVVPDLTDGCESAVSPLVNNPLARVPSRCVS